MSEYTPTSDQIRGVIAWRSAFARDRLTAEAFDRWLAEHDAKVLEDAATLIRHKQHPESIRQILNHRAASLRVQAAGREGHEFCDARLGCILDEAPDHENGGQ